MKDMHDFYCGTMFDAYEFFGAHIHEENDIKGVIFRVYAPNAKKVQVISDFNNWNGNNAEMEQIGKSGIFTYFSEDAEIGMYYKYLIFDKYGNCTEKTDPYAFFMELRPHNASRIVDLNTYEFSDKEWITNRTKNFDKPLNIYELHFGSWKHKNLTKFGHDSKQESNSYPDSKIDISEKWFNYMEIGPELIKYVKENNYTHIEILPLCEHPSDCSWGYQVTGFFSPTARYGKPADLMEFIDLCHRENIGVIMDFVPVHFALDSYGLGKFDGEALYEYPSDDTGYTEWGSHSFNYYRGEVRSFLQSVANFWIEVYHIDGIRMDAISNLIYWKGDSNRGINEGGVEFIKNMNSTLNKLHNDVMLIAEDSSDYPKVTSAVEDGGLGFDYKWDMGWMNDTLDYFEIKPWKRGDFYNKITFSMMYFYNEKFLLPFSHDEAVHGKKTIIDKMWGTYKDKFDQAKVLYTYMFTHPGKKLNFMGNELGHFREWDEKKELDWILLNYPAHDSFKKFISELNKLYLNSPVLYKNEYSRENFEWLQADDSEKCVYVYQRKSKDETLVIFLNTFCCDYKDYEVKFDKPVILEEILNTDWEKYGGHTKYSNETVKSTKIEAPKDEKESFKASVSLPAFTAKVYRVL